MAEHASVVRVTRFQPAAGKRDELKAELEGSLGTIRAMDGCFGIQLCSVRESPDEVVAISRWASQGALEPLNQLASSRMSQITPLVTGQPRTEHFISL